MVNARQEPDDGEKAAFAAEPIPASARADLVNSGRDTQITFRDGSTIVLKGVTHVEAVFPSTGIAPKADASPMGDAASGAAG